MKNKVTLICMAITLVVIGCRTKPIAEPEKLTVEHQRKLLENKAYAIPFRQLDSSLLINSLRFISSDAAGGRNENTQGHEMIGNYIETNFRSFALDSLKIAYSHPFIGTLGVQSRNLAGIVKGTQQPDKYIAVTAHYDHLGTDSHGNIYNGADDNASGVACLLALAKYISNNPLKYSVLFIATDMEEDGLKGALSIVSEFRNLNLLDKIVLNINMDMIARSDNNEIFAAGVYLDGQFPKFNYLIDEVQPKTNIHILLGHDTGGLQESWAYMSDHAAFMQAGVPFIYFGVEDHADYHQVTDDFEKIDLSNYVETCNMILQVLQTVR